jgi:S-adenosylmethionine decarboxylase
LKILGFHTLLEFKGCTSIIDNIEKVEAIMLKAIKIAKVTLVKKEFHKFSPYGISGVLILKESHFSIHTWPENGIALLDLFTCKKINTNKVIKFLYKKFKAKDKIILNLERGKI